MSVCSKCVCVCECVYSKNVTQKDKTALCETHSADHTKELKKKCSSLLGGTLTICFVLIVQLSSSGGLTRRRRWAYEKFSKRVEIWRERIWFSLCLITTTTHHHHHTTVTTTAYSRACAKALLPPPRRKRKPSAGRGVGRIKCARIARALCFIIERSAFLLRAKRQTSSERRRSAPKWRHTASRYNFIGVAMALLCI